MTLEDGGTLLVYVLAWERKGVEGYWTSGRQSVESEFYLPRRKRLKIAQ